MSSYFAEIDSDTAANYNKILANIKVIVLLYPPFLLAAPLTIHPSPLVLQFLSPMEGGGKDESRLLTPSPLSHLSFLHQPFFLQSFGLPF